MSDLETGIPSDAALLHALRDAVVAIYKSGKTDDLTVKRVRIRAEEELGLPVNFFKSGEWKCKSSDVIHEAVVRIVNHPAAYSAPFLTVVNRRNTAEMTRRLHPPLQSRKPPRPNQHRRRANPQMRARAEPKGRPPRPQNNPKSEPRLLCPPMKNPKQSPQRQRTLCLRPKAKPLGRSSDVRKRW